MPSITRDSYEIFIASVAKMAAQLTWARFRAVRTLYNDDAEPASLAYLYPREKMSAELQIANPSMVRPQGYLLILNWSLSAIGGVTEQFLNLAYRMKKGADYKPHILIPNLNPVHREVWQHDGENIPVLSLRFREPWNVERRWRTAIAFLLTLPFTLLELARLLRRHNIQVVNPHFPGLACIYFVLLRRLGLHGASLVLSFHGTDLHAILNARGIERRLWAYILRSVDVSITCGASMAKQALIFEPSASVQVIHNGVNPTEFTPQAVERYPFPGECRGRIALLNIAKFEHNKAQDVLLEAFARVKSIVPDSHLLLVGAKGPRLAHTQQQIKDLALQDFVSLYQNCPHERIASLLMGARLFVLPSRREGFPVTLLEAGVCGTPVVATTVDGIPELITDGEHGRLVRPDDAQGLADTIIELLGDPQQAKRLAANLKHRVLAEFTVERTYNKYFELCKDLESGRGQRRPLS
jgi:glycosyltransferase involved in cell wall biosynthesis